MLSLSGLVEERTLVALLELVLLVSFAGVVQRTSGFLTPTSLWCSKSKGQFSVNLTTYKKLTATAMMSSTTQPQGQEVIQGKAIQGLSEVAALYDVFLIGASKRFLHTFVTSDGGAVSITALNIRRACQNHSIPCVWSSE